MVCHVRKAIKSNIYLARIHRTLNQIHFRIRQRPDKNQHFRLRASGKPEKTSAAALIYYKTKVKQCFVHHYFHNKTFENFRYAFYMSSDAQIHVSSRVCLLFLRPGVAAVRLKIMQIACPEFYVHHMFLIFALFDS